MYTWDESHDTGRPRMRSSTNARIPGAPQVRKGERLMEERGDQRVQVYRELGDFLARINLSTSAAWSYELKTFPRPTGEATRAISTEDDRPRKLAQPHDVVLAARGPIW